MFPSLLLLSCQGLGLASSPTTVATTTTTAAVPETHTRVIETPPPMPSGALVQRQCFARTRDEESRRSYNYPGSPPPPPAAAPFGGYGTTGSSSTASRASAPAKAAEAKPSSAADAASAPATVAPMPSTPVAQGASVGASGGGEGAMYGGADKKDMGPMAAAEPAQVAEKSKSEAGRLGTREAPPADGDQGYSSTPAQANLDWGAKVYLSNDDSMSLASAQRLLWAVQKKGPVEVSNVRPHEFLNYFSFDTAAPLGDDLFSVLGSAEQTDSDTLTMAFAVHGIVPKRKPLDLTLVLDRSGSMSAEGRMEYLKRGLTKMTESLQTGDRVDLVLFDDQICTPLENFVVGRDDPSLLTSTIAQLAPRGSTDLDAGLEEGYRVAATHVDVAGRNRRMMLISDALLNTGNIDPDTVTQVGKAFEASNIRLTAIGVGRDFNDKVLDMLSEKGKGAYVYLGSEAVVDRVFGVGFQSLTQTIAHDVRFSLDLPPSLAMERFYGEESSTNPEDVQPINYYGGTTQLFLQDLKMRGGTVVRSEPVTLNVEYTDADTNQRETMAWNTTVGALMDADPHNLHKGRALMAWTDLILARAMGGNPCGAPFATWQQRVLALGPDTEINWLDGLTAPLCGAAPVPPVAPVARAGVPYKVHVDSDMPIAEVSLACQGWKGHDDLSSSDTVASFNATPGSCTLTLNGVVPMATTVTVPATGADIRCMVRGGRMSCG